MAEAVEEHAPQESTIIPQIPGVPPRIFEGPLRDDTLSAAIAKHEEEKLKRLREQYEIDVVKPLAAEALKAAGIDVKPEELTIDWATKAPRTIGVDPAATLVLKRTGWAIYHFTKDNVQKWWQDINESGNGPHWVVDEKKAYLFLNCVEAAETMLEEMMAGGLSFVGMGVSYVH